MSFNKKQVKNTLPPQNGNHLQGLRVRGRVYVHACDIYKMYVSMHDVYVCVYSMNLYHTDVFIMYMIHPNKKRAPKYVNLNMQHTEQCYIFHMSILETIQISINQDMNK